MNTKDLCKHLRGMCDGVASEAADKIERQQELLDMAWEAICEAGYEDHSFELREWMGC